jgi:cobalt-zinc-cadmium efflux system protein
MGDAGHLVSDATALGLAALAARVARQPATERHSYGLGRVEILAGVVNGLFMLAVVVGIAWAAVGRLLEPEPVRGGMVLVVAGLGLLVNLGAAWLLHGGEGLNVRGALLHVLGDLLGSVAALVSGAVILATGWSPIDPLLSLLICALILVSSLKLLREGVHVLLEGVPSHLDLAEVGERMAAEPGVDSVHDLHIWNLDSGLTALSAHLVVADMRDWPTLLDRLQALLRDEMAIEHATLQPEPRLRPLHPVPRSEAPLTGPDTASDPPGSGPGAGSAS